MRKLQTVFATAALVGFFSMGLGAMQPVHAVAATQMLKGTPVSCMKYHIPGPNGTSHTVLVCDDDGVYVPAPKAG